VTVDKETEAEIRRLFFGEHWKKGTIVAQLGVHQDVVARVVGPHGPEPQGADPRPSVLDPYRDSAATIEGSDLDYTILRPGWFTHEDEVSYQITQKGEPFLGRDVSLNSLSDLIVKLALTPGMESRHSVGVSRL